MVVTWDRDIWRVALLAIAVALGASGALAVDRVSLRDGTVLEGAVFGEEPDFIRIRLSDGRVEFIERSRIESVVRDADAARAESLSAGDDSKTITSERPEPAAPAPPVAAAGAVVTGDAGRESGATRAVILPFGPPSEWQGVCGDTVGVQITAEAWKRAIPLLEKDKVDVVVVRINSGGGLLSEVPKFHEVFEQYRSRWRTVAWVESAISAAAMAPWVLPEFYFMPEGTVGACTAFSGNMEAAGGEDLAEILVSMERASRLAGRDPAIMHAMQVSDPLSCTIDETGIVRWFPDSSGSYLVNPADRILVLNSQDAMKYRVANGIAATRDELARAMGLREVEWVGREGAHLIERSMKRADQAHKEFDTLLASYRMVLEGARAVQDRRARIREVGVARRKLHEIEGCLRISPQLAQRLPAGWIEDQEMLLRALLRQ
jgi:hypothetical protein